MNSLILAPNDGIQTSPKLFLAIAFYVMIRARIELQVGCSEIFHLQVGFNLVFSVKVGCNKDFQVAT
jgi:hypothetical protein